MSAQEGKEQQQSVSSAPAVVWKFGYGSNMSASFLAQKKGVNVLEFHAAVLKGWRLAFPSGGIDHVEPSFASILPSEGDEVHGVVCGMPKEDADRLDKAEGGGDFYLHMEVEVTTYAGDTHTAAIYAMQEKKRADVKECPCSLRYKNILLRGARESHLAPQWIERLEAMDYYVPPQEIIEKRRAAIPEDISSLPAWTRAQMAVNKDDDEKVYIGNFGLIVRGQPSPFFKSSHAGRDITNRNVLHFNGKNLEEHDTDDRPFPVVAQLSRAEHLYALSWLDYVLSKGEVVARLAPFWDRQVEAHASSGVEAAFSWSRDEWVVPQ
jgi:hypothetical protein